MKKAFEEPTLDVLRFEMKERITWEEVDGDDFEFGTMTSENIGDWE